MRVVMTSYQITAAGLELRPGDIAEFDDAEAARLVEVGGAREVTPEDEAAAAAAKAAADAAAAEIAAAEAAAAAPSKKSK